MVEIYYIYGGYCNSGQTFWHLWVVLHLWLRIAFIVDTRDQVKTGKLSLQKQKKNKRDLRTKKCNEEWDYGHVYTRWASTRGEH